MKTQIAGYETQILCAGQRTEALPLILLNGDRNETETIFEEVRRINEKGFILLGIQVRDWNSELSPWPSKAIFKGGEDFSGNADSYLKTILEKILPEAEDHLKSKDIRISSYGIAGYSLAGLFALYSAYRTNRFSRIASVSGSLWYPGLMEMVKKEKISTEIRTVYLSLGDKEALTRNPVMATVRRNSEMIAEHLNRSASTVFELNEGNHFKDPGIRTAKGISYILNN